jgi:hypothetical protein
MAESNGGCVGAIAVIILFGAVGTCINNQNDTKTIPATSVDSSSTESENQSSSSKEYPVSPEVESEIAANQELLRKVNRKLSEEKQRIEDAIVIYSEYSMKVSDQKQEITKLIAETSYSRKNAYELFGKAEPPEALFYAYSAWKNAIPDAKAQVKLETWLNEQKQANLIGELENMKKLLENAIRVDLIIGTDEKESIIRLINTPVKNLNDKFSTSINLDIEAVRLLNN